MTEPDHYQILHVDPGAPEEIIRASYLTMMKRLKNHPDLGGEHANAILINQAYEILTDSRRRSEYDQRRRQNEPSAIDPSEDQIGARNRAPSAGPRHDCLFCGASVRSPENSEDPECTRCGSPLKTFKIDLPDASNQRALDRFPKRQQIDFRTRPGQKAPHIGESLDISPQGMQFVTKHALRLEEIIQIDCAACCAVARVAYISRSGDSHVTGVEFLARRFKRTTGTFVSTRS